MKESGRIFRLLFCILLFLVFSACTEKTNPSSQEINENDEPLNTAAEIFDEAGNKLGRIEQNGSATFCGEDILYTSVTDKNETEYRLFSPENGTAALLGTIRDQSYEAAYSRLEFQGKVYTLAVTGNLYDNEKDPLWLLEISPDAGLRQYKITDNGFPYANMTLFGGKILIFHHDQGETSLTDRVIEFDPESGELREVLNFSLENELHGDSLRGLYGDGGKLRLLRLHFENESEVSLWMDEYAAEETADDSQAKTSYEKTGELEITSFVRSAAENAGSVAQDAVTELEQTVAYFRVIEGRYLWYENFSITHCLADLENGTVYEEADPTFSIVPGNMHPVFWRLLGGNDGEDRSLYLLKDGALEKTDLPFVNEGEKLLSASLSQSGKGLFAVSSGEKGLDFRYCISQVIPPQQ